MSRLLVGALLAAADAAGAPASTPCAWNQNEKLQPPNGAWRGAVVDDTRFTSVQNWEHHYGFPLHMKRVFKANGWGNLTQDEVEFVQAGGVLFYTIPISHPLSFKDFIGKRGAWRVRDFADVIKPLAPAKVLITMRYEVELWVDPAKPEKYLGSPEEYRELWRSFQDGFQAAGVTNAVWAMDYSTKATHPDYHPLLAALWPGDGRVDWLLWNTFQYGADTKRSARDMLDAAYGSFESLSGVAQEFNGTTHTADYTSAASWGLGAWGADLTSGSEEQRAQFIEDMATALDSSRYPRLKAQVYFDTKDANSGTGSIIQKAQKAAYARLNGLSLFSTNDDCASARHVTV